MSGIRPEDAVRSGDWSGFRSALDASPNQGQLLSDLFKKVNDPKWAKENSQDFTNAVTQLSTYDKVRQHKDYKKFATQATKNLAALKTDAATNLAQGIFATACKNKDDVLAQAALKAINPSPEKRHTFVQIACAEGRISVAESILAKRVGLFQSKTKVVSGLWEKQFQKEGEELIKAKIREGDIEGLKEIQRSDTSRTLNPFTAKHVAYAITNSSRADTADKMWEQGKPWTLADTKEFLPVAVNKKWFRFASKAIQGLPPQELSQYPLEAKIRHERPLAALFLIAAKIPDQSMADQLAKESGAPHELGQLQKEPSHYPIESLLEGVPLLPKEYASQLACDAWKNNDFTLLSRLQEIPGFPVELKPLTFSPGIKCKSLTVDEGKALASFLLDKGLGPLKKIEDLLWEGDPANCTQMTTHPGMRVNLFMRALQDGSPNAIQGIKSLSDNEVKEILGKLDLEQKVQLLKCADRANCPEIASLIIDETGVVPLARVAWKSQDTTLFNFLKNKAGFPEKLKQVTYRSGPGLTPEQGKVLIAEGFETNESMADLLWAQDPFTCVQKTDNPTIHALLLEKALYDDIPSRQMQVLKMFSDEELKGALNSLGPTNSGFLFQAAVGAGSERITSLILDQTGIVPLTRAAWRNQNADLLNLLKNKAGFPEELKQLTFSQKIEWTHLTPEQGKALTKFLIAEGFETNESMANLLWAQDPSTCVQKTDNPTIRALLFEKALNDVPSPRQIQALETFSDEELKGALKSRGSTKNRFLFQAAIGAGSERIVSLILDQTTPVDRKDYVERGVSSYQEGFTTPLAKATMIGLIEKYHYWDQLERLSYKTDCLSYFEKKGECPLQVSEVLLPVAIRTNDLKLLQRLSRIVDCIAPFEKQGECPKEIAAVLLGSALQTKNGEQVERLSRLKGMSIDMGLLTGLAKQDVAWERQAGKPYYTFQPPSLQVALCVPVPGTAQHLTHPLPPDLKEAEKAISVLLKDREYLEKLTATGIPWEPQPNQPYFHVESGPLKVTLCMPLPGSVGTSTRALPTDPDLVGAAITLILKDLNTPPLLDHEHLAVSLSKVPVATKLSDMPTDVQVADLLLLFDTFSKRDPNDKLYIDPSVRSGLEVYVRSVVQHKGTLPHLYLQAMLVVELLEKENDQETIKSQLTYLSKEGKLCAHGSAADATQEAYFSLSGELDKLAQIVGWRPFLNGLALEQIRGTADAVAVVASETQSRHVKIYAMQQLRQAGYPLPESFGGMDDDVYAGIGNRAWGGPEGFQRTFPSVYVPQLVERIVNETNQRMKADPKAFFQLVEEFKDYTEKMLVATELAEIDAKYPKPRDAEHLEAWKRERDNLITNKMDDMQFFYSDLSTGETQFSPMGAMALMRHYQFVT